MGSHMERRDVEPGGCDVVEGWTGVERALAYVDQMVGTLVDMSDDVDDLPAVSDGDEDDQATCSRQSTSRDSSDDVIQPDDKQSSSSCLDDGSPCCVTDASELL